MLNNVKCFGELSKSNISTTVGVNLFSEMCILYDMSALVLLEFFHVNRSVLLSLHVASVYMQCRNK